MNLNDVQVRRATSDDFNDVMNVERLAFGEDDEAVLVKDLLADQTAEPYVSLLACYQGEAISFLQRPHWRGAILHLLFISWHLWP